MAYKDKATRNANERAKRAANPEKSRAYSKAWNAKNPEKVRAKFRKWAVANRDKAHAQQARWRETNLERKQARNWAYLKKNALAGRPRTEFCEACGRPPDHRGIVFDHCHVKGHFRGWLCHKCNATLGFMDDNPMMLRQLAAYVERNRENTSPQLALVGI
jgi:hypothetical protein